KGSDLPALLRVPHLDRVSPDRTRTEEPLAVRAPGEAVLGPPLVFLETEALPARRGGPQLDRAVSIPAENVLAVGAPRHAQHAFRVPLEGDHLLAPGHVPDLQHRARVAAGEEPSAVGAPPRGGRDVRAQAVRGLCHGEDGPALRHVPYLQGL